MLHLGWPWVLIALPLPFIVYHFLKPVGTDSYEAALFAPFYNKLSSMMGEQETVTPSNSKKKFILPTVIWVLLLLAASKPVWLGDPVIIENNGRDLMMAVDLSGSMEINDMVINNRQVDRLTATKLVINNFVQRRRGDRLGLILFGSQAYLQVPMTFDHQTVKTLMDESEIGMAGNKTAIGDAIGLTIKHLRKRPEGNRVLILLTDGANTAGEITPLQSAQIAKQEGIKIYTIGLGAEEMLERSFFGTRRVNPSADLDEETLQELSSLTGGQYFRARNIQELEKIYTLLDQLEPITHEEESFRPSKNLFFWPLSFVLLLSITLVIKRLGLLTKLNSRHYTSGQPYR